MQIIIEFPVSILATYHGVSNLDETIDENLTIFIERYFYHNNISFKILSLNFKNPVPNTNDELFQYIIEIYGTPY